MRRVSSDRCKRIAIALTASALAMGASRHLRPRCPAPAGGRAAPGRVPPASGDATGGPGRRRRPTGGDATQ